MTPYPLPSTAIPSQEPGFLKTSIYDTDIGISKKQSPFLPLAPLDSSLNHMFEGTDPGLALCACPVKADGISIWLEKSEPDRESHSVSLSPYRQN